MQDRSIVGHAILLNACVTLEEIHASTQAVKLLTKKHAKHREFFTIIFSIY